MAMGVKKSSARTSPGWMGGRTFLEARRLVVVDNLDFVGMTILPNKTH